MKKLGIIILALVLVGFTFSGASAATIGLYDWGLNIDGSLTLPGDSLPGEVDDSLFDFVTGLGTLTVDIGPGAHSVDFFVDHEIDETINTFFNEDGATSGAPAAGQSWEIDEPGCGGVVTMYFGDIFDNFALSALDNDILQNFFDGTSGSAPEDISMAMGWDLSGSAVVSFILSETMPGSGFYLSHADPDSDATIYFSSSVRTDGQVPEPATMLLLGTGLLGLAVYGRKRFNHT